MKKLGSIISKFVDILFGIALIVCCVVMIYALIIFVKNCNYLRWSITSLVNNYEMALDTNRVNVDDISSDVTSNSKIDVNSSMKQEKPNQVEYLESLIDYSMKLQELEANSTSMNILTFIYTFLSGTLIGIATYFTKKSADSVKQIKENKELIINLDSRILFSNFHMYVQRMYSTMQIFVLSMDAIQDNGTLSNFINKYVPKINEFMQEMLNFAERNRNNVSLLNYEERQSILNEINSIGNLINCLNVPEGNFLLTNADNDQAKGEWRNQVNKVKRIIKNNM